MEKMFIYILCILSLCCVNQHDNQEESTKLSSDSITYNVNVEAFEGRIPVNLNVDKRFLLGQHEFKSNTNFVKVEKEHGYDDVYLLKVVYASFQEMYKQALKDGVRLTIISGTRGFSDQKRIWDNKWDKHEADNGVRKAKSILEYSAMPGASRHHWGTDFDINSVENTYFKEGKGAIEYNWLSRNAHKYGFCQVYDRQEKTKRSGYQEEKWHWSYMPVSNYLLNLYNDKVGCEDINGFNGADLVCELSIIDGYVNGISSMCSNAK